MQYLILLLMVIFLAGCSENPLQDTGSTIGAIGGGIAGSKLGGQGIKAIAGGALGAIGGKIAGGAIGKMADEAARKSKKPLANKKFDDSYNETMDSNFNWNSPNAHDKNPQKLSQKPKLSQEDLFVNDEGYTCYYLASNNYAQNHNNIIKKTACLDEKGKWFLYDDG